LNFVDEVSVAIYALLASSTFHTSLRCVLVLNSFKLTVLSFYHCVQLPQILARRHCVEVSALLSLLPFWEGLLKLIYRPANQPWWNIIVLSDLYFAHIVALAYDTWSLCRWPEGKRLSVMKHFLCMLHLWLLLLMSTLSTAHS